MQHPNAILRARGLKPSRHRGQNFLTQPATARAIAASAGITPQDTVVEIGAGLGTLTLALAPLARRVVAVEVDRGVFAALEDVLAEAGVQNVEPRLADALKLDWAELARQAGERLVVAGNLPYLIASPLIFHLLDNRHCWRRAVLMVQEEMARRLAAEPGIKDYGRLSVLVQTWCQVQAGIKVGPDQFYPRPAVSSRVVHFTPLHPPRVDLASPEQVRHYARVVKAAFSHRRKTLANSLSGGLGISRQQAQQALQQAGLDPNRRAETLSVEEFHKLALSLSDKRVG